METEIKRKQGTVEAVLFASGEAVSLDRLAAVLELDKPTASKLVANLAEHFNAENSGIRIVRLADGWQMCTRPEFANDVRNALDLRRNMPLSQAALEVLAVVAYNEPVTKAFVEQVRGVDCSGVLSGLVAKGLVEERGRLELPGKPLLYGTTSDFLRCAGITSLDELPSVGRKETEPDGQELEENTG